MRTWLACAGGNPVVALAGKLAPLFAIFFLIMLAVPLILEGMFGISFKGDVPMIIVAGSLLIVGYLALGALLQLLVRDLATGLGLTGLIVSPAFGFAGRRISDPRHERVLAGLGRDPAVALVHGGAARAGGARTADPRIRTLRSRRLPGWRCSTRVLALLRLRAVAKRTSAGCRRSAGRAGGRAAQASAGPSSPSGGVCFRSAALSSCWFIAPLLYGVYYPQPYLNQILRKIPIAVVDNDLSELSRSIVQTLDASGAVSVAVRAETLAEAQAAVDRGEAFAVVGIPPASRTRRAQGQCRPHSDLRRCDLPVHLPDHRPAASRPRSIRFRPSWRPAARAPTAVSSRRRSHRRAPPRSCCSRSSIRSAATRATSCRPPSC